MGSQRGILVDIEGVDAVGKKTQSSLLVSWLRSRQVATNSIAFPVYGTLIGREIKAYLLGGRTYTPEVGHMLYAVNRWEKKGDLERLLTESEVVVVNRYSASNLAYGTARGLRVEWLMNLEEGLPKADLVLVLDASPTVLASRRGNRKDTYERDLQLQEKVREMYLGLSRELEWTVIDASKGIEGTNRALASAVSKALATRGRTV